MKPSSFRMLFHAYVRDRDQLPNGKWKCICCNKEVDKVVAGHYLPAKFYSWLKFDKDNVHAQCYGCNIKNGSWLQYRVGLIKKIGAKRLKELEQRGLTKPTVKRFIWTAAKIEKIKKDLKL